MARVDIIMPQMGESIAEGTLSKWLKKVGDEVKRDEPIFEISTDKVDAEIPSPAAGVIAEIIVKEGETVAVQTVVARLETEKGAALGKSDAPAASGTTSSPAGKQSEKAASTPTPQREATPASGAARQQPPAPAIAASHTGNGNSFEDRVRTKSSPLVRKIAAEHGVNIASLQGSGVAGRVTKRDILGFIESGASTTSPVQGGRTGGHAYRCPSPGLVMSSSRCRRCARSSASTWSRRDKRRRTSRRSSRSTSLASRAFARKIAPSSRQRPGRSSPTCRSSSKR